MGQDALGADLAGLLAGQSNRVCAGRGEKWRFLLPGTSEPRLEGLTPRA